MADTNTATDEAVKPKKSKKKLIIIVLFLLLLIGGGAGGFFYMRSVSAAAAEKEASEKEDKSEEDTEGDKGDKENASDPNSIDSAIPEDEEVKHVVELQPFIINLADDSEPRYLRLTVSIGIGEEGESEKPDEIFITRIRNAILAVLTTKKSEEILTVEGKAILRKQILKAAQQASEEPHVLAIYITDFIVQM